jgi:hypothetical protein
MAEGRDMRRLKLTIGDVAITAEILNTPTADALYEAAPFTSSTQTWGEEVYFSTPVKQDQEEDARDVMNLGELAFWPPGNAIAIGYGRTPISDGDEIRLASPANVWGHAVEDVRTLSSIRSGTPIQVDKD